MVEIYVQDSKTIGTRKAEYSWSELFDGCAWKHSWKAWDSQEEVEGVYEASAECWDGIVEGRTIEGPREYHIDKENNWTDEKWEDRWTDTVGEWNHLCSWSCKVKKMAKTCDMLMDDGKVLERVLSLL